MLLSELLNSYFIGGFECSAHRRFDGKRLDLIAATGHDRLAAQDYRQLAGYGLRTLRDGIRWHLIEATPGRYEWSSFLPMLRAARDAGVQVIWDLCHYGWPDAIDIWTPAFIDHFARFAAAAARLIRDETDAIPLFCPVNEISYWSWAGGEVARMNPFARNRGIELKKQLVRAAIAAIEAIWSVDPRARIIHTDPVIHVLADARRPQDRARAEAYRCAQFQVWDLLSGRLWPELGGHPKYLDIIGANYYWNNQWIYSSETTGDGVTVGLGHPGYRPFQEILAENYNRYGRPILVSETGSEGAIRRGWFRYMAGEIQDAIAAGVPVAGICLYPILHYPGWLDERHCECGLLGAVPADRQGFRPVYQPLADELRRQQATFATMVQGGHRPRKVAGGIG